MLPRNWGQSRLSRLLIRLYECISEMKKGSASDYDAETGEESAGSEISLGESHEHPHYIGFDVHNKTISFCVKTAAGEIVEEGSVVAERGVLRQWAAARRQPWRGRWKRLCSCNVGLAEALVHDRSLLKVSRASEEPIVVVKTTGIKYVLSA